MVKEMVVKDFLSHEMIAAGAELTRRLDEANLIVDAALWSYTTDSRTWRFIIASPEVRTHGPKWVYKKVQTVLFRMPPEYSKISLKDIAVVDNRDPLITLLGTAIKTGEGVANIRFSQNVINGVFIEDAYIYRLR